MNSIDLVVLNLEEVRRRSLKVWQTIPSEKYGWKPDKDAMSATDMIRHVLASEYNYFQIIQNRKSVKNPVQPFKKRAFTTVEDEIAFAETYRAQFMEYVKLLSPNDLTEVKIDRSDLSELGFPGYIRQLGDFLLRIAYHEAVHTGQLLDYLRTMGIERPDIWD